MLRTHLHTVKVRFPGGALGVALLALAACYWSRYPELMETHLEVLSQYARKLQSVADQGRAMGIEQWPEFVYPLERARDFARIVAPRFPDRRSLARFRIVLESYARLLEDPKLLERKEGAAEVDRRVEALEAAVMETREALREEAG
jgi:hypothetical protein